MAQRPTTGGVPRPDERLFPPAVVNAARVLAGLGGLLCGVAMLVFGALQAALSTCDFVDATPTALCESHGGLIGPLEVFAVLAGAAAAAAGGIGSAVSGRARWVAGGFAVTAACGLLLDVLVGAQQLRELGY